MAATSFRELQQQLNDMAERSTRQGTQPVFRDIAADYREAQQANYLRGGKPKWRPVSAEYAAQKAREGKGNRTGVYTGGLLRSLTRSGDRYNIERTTRDGDLVMGSANPVAHLFGGKHRTRNQPRRRPVVLTPVMRRDYLQRVQDHLAGDS